MIFGIGCDLCEIKRFEKNAEKLIERTFSEGEKEMLMKKFNKPQSAAANFAVKEAFSKALGTGIRGFSLKEVETLRDELGKPYINLYGNAKIICEKKGITGIFVSISHTDELAQGYVVLER